MSIYSTRMALRPGYWSAPEKYKKNEQSGRIAIIAGPILAAIGMLLSTVVSVVIPIAIGIAIGAWYVYRKNAEKAAPDAPPPPYSASVAGPSTEPPPYPSGNEANAAFAFWDPSPYYSTHDDKVSKTEVDAILSYYGNDPKNVSLSFQSRKKADAFIQYVNHMTEFEKIGDYIMQQQDLNTLVTFRPFPPERQINNKQLYVADLLYCLRFRQIAPHIKIAIAS